MFLDRIFVCIHTRKRELSRTEERLERFHVLDNDEGNWKGRERERKRQNIGTPWKIDRDREPLGSLAVTVIFSNGSLQKPSTIQHHRCRRCRRRRWQATASSRFSKSFVCYGDLSYMGLLHKFALRSSLRPIFVLLPFTSFFPPSSYAAVFAWIFKSSRENAFDAI